MDRIVGDGKTQSREIRRRNQYNSSLLYDAVKCVLRGKMNCHQAAIRFKIPRSTIQRRINLCREQHRLAMEHRLRQERSVTPSQMVTPLLSEEPYILDAVDGSGGTEAVVECSHEYIEGIVYEGDEQQDYSTHNQYAVYQEGSSFQLEIAEDDCEPVVLDPSSSSTGDTEDKDYVVRRSSSSGDFIGKTEEVGYGGTEVGYFLSNEVVEEVVFNEDCCELRADEVFTVGEGPSSQQEFIYCNEELETQNPAAQGGDCEESTVVLSDPYECGAMEPLICSGEEDFSNAEFSDFDTSNCLDDNVHVRYVRHVSTEEEELERAADRLSEAFRSIPSKSKLSRLARSVVSEGRGERERERRPRNTIPTVLPLRRYLIVDSGCEPQVAETPYSSDSSELQTVLLVDGIHFPAVILQSP